MMGKPARSGHRWTPEELHYLSDRYGLMSDETLARHLGRSTNGIEEAAVKRLHGRRRSDNFYSASELARVLGLSASWRVVRWVEHGWLKGRKGPVSRGHIRMWSFREHSIVKCLRQRPWLVDLAFMPEHYFRSVVRKEWEWDPWYTSEQAAPLLGVTTTTSVLKYIHLGWLPAEKCPGRRGTAYSKWHWVIRQSAIQAFLANDPRPQNKYRALSESRRKLLLESSQASKLAVVWLTKCPRCGQEVRIAAPPQLYGPQVRERFIRLYVNGNCQHGSECLISLSDYSIC